MNKDEAQAFVDAWLLNGPPALPSASGLSIDELTAKAQEAVDQNVMSEAKHYLIELMHRGFQPARTYLNLGRLASEHADVDEAMDWYRKSIALDPSNQESHGNLIFLQDVSPTTTDAQAVSDRLNFFTHCCQDIYAKRKRHHNTPDPDRPLRIGYVGGDWNFHSAAIAFSSVIASHTDDRYLAFAYSTLHPDHGDHVTREWRRFLGDRYLECYGLSPSQLAAVIRHDEMDILVDLSGFTARHRLLTFAEKPAPIQVQGWGYVLGTAFPAMDVIFADPIVCPPSVQANLTEHVYHLPSLLGFKAFDQTEDPPDLPCLTQDPIFAIFQRSIKINDDNLGVYRRLLEALPNAKIMFKGANFEPFRAQQIAQAFKGLENRLIFAPPTSHHDHQSYYTKTDLSLDTWPQTGGVSTLESLYMGVPVLTLIGPRMIERTSASILTNCGMTEFIAESKGEYIEKAIRYVTTDRTRLAKFRRSSRERLMTSPIVVGYTEAVETAYRSLWHDWCAKQLQKVA